jgi:hypothetical protein
MARADRGAPDGPRRARAAIGRRDVFHRRQPWRGGGWDEAYAQIVKPRLIGTVKWRRVSERAGTKAVLALIDAARESRLAKFRVCEHCGERMPPEWMHDEHACVSCAQHQSGAVH